MRAAEAEAAVDGVSLDDCAGDLFPEDFKGIALEFETIYGRAPTELEWIDAMGFVPDLH